jgi:hypothetical protein
MRILVDERETDGLIPMTACIGIPATEEPVKILEEFTKRFL